MVELATWHQRYADLGYGVAAMTYDARDTLAAFHAKHDLPYPLLQDIERRHVTAFGILNEDYQPGDSGYGIPHPGVIVIDQNGIVVGKLAAPGFRDRPSFEAIHDALGSE